MEIINKKYQRSLEKNGYKYNNENVWISATTFRRERIEKN